ncbi:dihydrolipoyl dehydrogenase [Anaerosoma tenue]|uniref:dihydrolipoyl dehydrogenase n=1 Tax=Anaerosoma tenue TaxID=2933588 RepID=UPI002B2762D5|nr:dihydrolipoyl dehydrogenase [Anaerosoma tenue]
MHIVVLGGGPGGYGAAFEAARLGADVTLIERERLGGTCLNWGCIPTKTILRSAHIVADTRDAAEFGLDSAVASVDVPALRSRKERVVDELVGQVESSAKRLKVKVVTGEGRLAGPKAVEVTAPDGATETIAGDALILATGSTVFRLPDIDHDLEGVWTSDDAVSLSEIPKDIVIIGGGVIGLEFACAYAAFGSVVTVVELMEQVLPGNDKRVVRQTQAALEALGVEFHLGDAVSLVERHDGRMRSTLRSGAAIESDVVMSAVGRMPNAAGFGYEEAGIEFDRRAVAVDEHLRTNIPGVYAVGDVIGGMMLAHVAEEEGVIAARNAVAESEHGAGAGLESVRYDCIPACVYTFPEVATVGSSRDSAKERGIDAVQAIAKFAANGKALGEGESDGFVQLVAEKGSGRIAGCQIVGPHAVETIHEVAVAMRHDLTVRQLAETVHAHPTVSEVIRMACADAAGKCGC